MKDLIIRLIRGRENLSDDVTPGSLPNSPLNDNVTRSLGHHLTILYYIDYWYKYDEHLQVPARNLN